VRIAVDLLGGDNAPAVVVDGALLACSVDPDLHLLLVGPPDVADEAVGALPGRVRPLVAADAVGMADAPVRAARHDTSVRTAVAAVSAGEADAFVSAGASGATVTAAVLGLGRWVRRPALAASLPSLAGPVVLVDVGATVEASASAICQNAILGAAYASVVHDVAAPRVGLLSIGAEAGKGDRVRRAADARLRELRLPAGASYLGNVEGYDVSVGGRADVIATDGFTGNVLLKGIEGAYKLAGGNLPAAIAPRAAALLGVHGTVVVCHGAAGAPDLASGLALAAQLCRIGAVARIAAAAGSLVEAS
jgi:glycerol-3-phosphate acyltransferase PlsX